MEKRSYPRVKKLYLISYVNKVTGCESSPVSLGRTLDISPSGARLEVYQLLMVDSIIEMEIGIREDKFSTRGKIVRVEQVDEKAYIIGIEFDELQNRLGAESKVKGQWDHLDG